MREDISAFIQEVRVARQLADAIKPNSSDAANQMQAALEALVDVAQKYHAIINSEHSEHEFDRDVRFVRDFISRRKYSEAIGTLAGAYDSMITVAERLP